MAHKNEIQKLILEEDRMYLQDRQDARRRQVESEKATGKRDINLYVLARMVVGLFFTLVGLLMFVVLPEANVGPLTSYSAPWLPASAWCSNTSSGPAREARTRPLQSWN